MKGLALPSLILMGVFVLGGCSDSVMEPDAALSLQTAEGRPADPGMQGKGAPKPGDLSIAAIAGAAGFSELVEALIYVDSNLDPSPGLVTLFSEGTDQYTVFAPTNQAFKDLLCGGTCEDPDISVLPPELVLNVLLYHVTEGRRASNSVVPPNPRAADRVIETLLEGATFSVDTDLVITAIGNTANILAADISASNGIIHVIDAVILPIE